MADEMIDSGTWVVAQSAKSKNVRRPWGRGRFITILLVRGEWFGDAAFQLGW